MNDNKNSVNNVFQIPHMENKDQEALAAFLNQTHEESLDANDAYIDFLSGAEEKLVAPQQQEQLPGYNELKKMQNDIEWMRQQTEPIRVAQYELSGILQPFADFVAPRTNDEFEKRILNIERGIGGKMMKKTDDIRYHHFWYDHNGEYFYEVQYVDQPKPSIVHYQILPNVMTKTSEGGQVVAFNPGEAEALLYRIRQYYHEVQDKFYGPMPKQSDYDLAA